MKAINTSIALIVLLAGGSLLQAEPTKPELIPPEPIEMVLPEVPYIFNGYPQTGAVMVKFEIDKEGEPRNVEVVSSMNPKYAKSVKKALSKWKFPAPEREGITYKMLVQFN